MVYAINLIGMLQYTVRTSAQMEDLVNAVLFLTGLLQYNLLLVGICRESEGLRKTKF